MGRFAIPDAPQAGLYGAPSNPNEEAVIRGRKWQVHKQSTELFCSEICWFVTVKTSSFLQEVC